MQETRYHKFFILVLLYILPTKIQMRRMTMNELSIIDGLK